MAAAAGATGTDGAATCGPASIPAQRPASEEAQRILIWAADFEALQKEHLTLLKDRFYTPLQRWGLIEPPELEQMFSNFDRVLDLSNDIHERCKTAIETDQEDRITVLVNAFFREDVLAQYSHYCAAATNSEKMVMRCLHKHDRFGAFVNVQQRKINITLEKLLRRPVESATAYFHVLKRILGCLPNDDSRTEECRTLLVGWTALIQDIEKAQQLKENEEKIAAIELSFPNNNLRLLSTREAASSNRKARRRLSAPGALLKFISQEAKTTFMGKRNSNTPSSTYSPQGAEAEIDDPRDVDARLFLREGPVSVVQDDDAKRRHLFLFNDVLLIAKPKGRATYSLKQRIKLREAWLLPRAPTSKSSSDLAFLIGGPAERNLVFTVQQRSDKDKWLSSLASAIAESKAKTLNCRGEVNVYPFVTEKGPQTSGAPSRLVVDIANTDTTTQVISAALRAMNLEQHDPAGFRLWELSSAGVQPLEAWECPYVITVVGKRVHVHVPECQFVLRNRKSSELVVEMLPPNLRMAVQQHQQAQTPATVARDHRDRAEDRKPKFDLKKKGSGFIKMVQNLTPGRSPPKSQPMTAATPGDGRPGNGELYGLPLSTIVHKETLPVALQAMLVRLYRDGPNTPGLFRKSANARVIRQIRERLDSGLPVDFEEVPILAVGAIFKEFLRSMPDCLIPLSHYADCVATNAIEDEQERVKAVSDRLSSLPAEHGVLLQCVVPVLVRVCKNSEDNAMTARNVGICVGQSMMWPAQPEDVLKNDVPPFIEFVLEHATDLFGDLAHPLFEGVEARRLEVMEDGWDSEDPETPPSSPNRVDRLHSMSARASLDMSSSSPQQLRRPPRPSPPAAAVVAAAGLSPLNTSRQGSGQSLEQTAEATCATIEPVAPPRRRRRDSELSTGHEAEGPVEVRRVQPRVATANDPATALLMVAPSTTTAPNAAGDAAAADDEEDVEAVEDLGRTTIV